MAVTCPKCHLSNPDTSRFCADCGTSLPPSKVFHPEVTETILTPVKELTTGSTFAGRYQVIEELGHGGMGKVYKVQDTDIKEKIALKLLRPEITLDKEAVERFSDELKLARKISHRNVCRMFDLGRAEGTTFITMEFVPGEDLKSFIHRSKQLNIGTAISIAKQVCEGLEEAHRLGVVHRDLKPGNIMIDKDGDAKIMDFGIARSLSGRGITGAGVLIGTPEYMSPEQVEGKDVDQRSDLYSLGVILYEMVTGRLPFAGDTPLSVAHKHKYEAAEDPKKINTQVSEDLARVILKCLAKEKDKRFQSAAELGTELESIENVLPTTERETSRPKPFTSREITVQLSGKKMAMAGVCLAVLAALVAAAVLFFRPATQKARSKVPAGPADSSWDSSIVVLPLKNASGDPQQDGFCYGITEQITANLSQIAALKVIDSSSARRIDLAENSVAEIGRLLDVRYVLEGSVQKSGERIRLTAKLVSTADGSLPWAKNYDGDLKDIFGVQDDISQQIGLALIQKLTPAAAREVKTLRSDSPEAYISYLQGAHLSNRYDHVPQPDIFRNAEAMLRKCVELDPAYAPAYAELSYLYGNIWAYRANAEKDGGKYLELSLEMSRKATELRPDLPEVLFAKAWVHWRDQQAGDLYRAAKRLLEVQPNHVRGNLLFGYVLRNRGLIHQSFPYFDKAGELDPLEPWWHGARGMAYWRLGDVKAAFAELDKSLKIEPDDTEMNGYYASALLQMRQADKAEPLLAKYRSLRAGNPLVDYESWLIALRGKGGEAVAYHEKNHGTVEGRMVLDNLLGDFERVVDYWVRTTEKEADDLSISRYLILQNHPFYDIVRKDARFQQVIEREKRKYSLVLKYYGFAK